MEKLRDTKCIPCHGGVSPAGEADIKQWLTQCPQWSVVAEAGIGRLERVFTFADFAEALEFTNRVAELAEAEGHHPAILTEWGRVTVRWWTHAIGGLHKNDFIMAARTDRLSAPVN